MDRHFSTSQAAEILGRSPQTLRNQRSQGKGPKGFPMGRGHRWLYPESELERFIEEERKTAAANRYRFEEKSTRPRVKRDRRDADEI
jgi:hypothetical protein